MSPPSCNDTGGSCNPDPTVVCCEYRDWSLDLQLKAQQGLDALAQQDELKKLLETNRAALYRPVLPVNPDGTYPPRATVRDWLDVLYKKSSTSSATAHRIGIVTTSASATTHPTGIPIRKAPSATPPPTGIATHTAPSATGHPIGIATTIPATPLRGINYIRGDSILPRGNAWTAEEDRLLLQLRDEGVTYREIAETHLTRHTKSSVQSRYNRIKRAATPPGSTAPDTEAGGSTQQQLNDADSEAGISNQPRFM